MIFKQSQVEIKLKKKAIQLILIFIPFIGMKFGFAHKLKIFV